MKYLRTSDLAKAVGVHPNTVRRYVDWGLLPPVERSPSGYRRFTERHLDCLRLARQIYCNQYPGRAIHQSGLRIIQAAVAGDLGGALELAYNHLALVQSERAQADVAAGLLERWAFGAPADATTQPLQIGQVARLLGVSIDIVPQLGPQRADRRPARPLQRLPALRGAGNQPPARHPHAFPRPVTACLPSCAC